MFTPGFKFFAGMATLSLIGAFVYGLSSGDASGPDYFGFVDRNSIIGLISLGWKGNIGQASGVVVLIFTAMTAAFLGGTAVAFRDADVESVAQLGDTPSVMPLAQRPTAPSWWPAATALGVGVLLIGLVMDTSAFWIIGLVLLAVVALEWALTAWAERSTGSDATNSILRDRVGASFEIPLLGLALGGVLALSVSRMFIAFPGLSAVAIAGALSVVVMGMALIAAFTNINRNMFAALFGLVAVAVVALGIATAIKGAPEHHGEDHSEEAIAIMVVVE